MNIHRRVHDVSPGCALCGYEYEDEDHCFTRCPWTTLVWRQFEKRMDWDMLGLHAAKTRVEWLVEKLDEEEQSLFGHLLWATWKARCLAVFEKKIPIAAEVCAQASNLTKEVLDTSTKPGIHDSLFTPLPCKWTPPTRDIIAINVDASFGDSDVVACGMIARSCDNLVMQAISKRLLPGVSVLHGELMAVKEGLKMALDMGYERIRLQSDCLAAISLILHSEDHLHPLFHLVHDCRPLARNFALCMFEFIRRSGNSPAHLLARLGVDSPLMRQWGNSLPSHVIKAVLADSGMK